MCLLYINIIFYGLLAWYFDHVDSSNRGKSYSRLFFLDKKYWCGTKVNKNENFEAVSVTKKSSNLSNKLLNDSSQYIKMEDDHDTKSNLSLSKDNQRLINFFNFKANVKNKILL